MKQLPLAQHEMLRLWVLGGIDAIGVHSTRTVTALLKTEYIDKNGPTKTGRDYVNYWEIKDNVFPVVVVR